jgi:hypothetical protein
MKVARLGIVVLLTLIPAFAGEEKHNARPKDGFVPNAETAIQIAVAVWTPIYGKEKIERQKPHKAYLKEGVWHVSGSMPRQQLGGVAIAEIAKGDARVIRVSHGK